jgi:hypothetical protein
VTTADPVWDSGDDAALASSGTSTTTITGLTPDMTYYFRVVGLDNAENEASVPGASEVSDTTQPAAGDILSAPENTPIRGLDPTVGETGLVMQRIRVESDTSGDGSIELAWVSVADQGSAELVDIATVTVYMSPDLVFSNGVQVGSATFNTDPVTITLDGGTVADRTVTNPSPKYLWVIYDLAGGAAAAGRTIQSRVTTIAVVAPDQGLTTQTLDSNLLTIITAPQNGTTAILNGASAFVSACSPSGESTGQITVSSRFQGDDDNDGWVEIRVDTDSNPADGTVACATASGPPPRTCLVTGLGPGTYWLQADLSDPDGVGGAVDPQVLNNGGAGYDVEVCGGSDTAAPTVLILAPGRDAIIGGAEKVKVQVFEDGGDLAATPLRWAVDDGSLSATDVTLSSNYTCGTDCVVYEFDLDTTTVNGGLTDDRHRLIVEVTDAETPANIARVEQAFRVRNQGTAAGGSGHLLRRTPGSRLCVDCHDLPTHSSQTTSTDYGNWAMACTDCHTPHRTTNINLLRQQIRTPNSGLVEVRFEAKTQAVADSSAGGTASYANEDAYTGAAHGPCQACHTKTQSSGGAARWQNANADGNADTHYRSGSNKVCSSCHKHTSGFTGAGGGACTDCHFGSLRNAATRRDIQDDFVNSNSQHAGTGTLTNFDCVVCHAEGTVNALGETETTDYHNDSGTKAGCSQAPTTPRPCIDLKDVDNWDNLDPNNSPVFRYDKQLLVENLSNLTPGDTPENWGSGSADWETETSNRLDPFCLTCHDYDGADASYNADNTVDSCGTPTDGLNPFCDSAITNDYDQYDRGRVTDIASRVARAWRVGEGFPSGYTAEDRDGTSEPRWMESPTCPTEAPFPPGCDIDDPPLGIYSRHAIRGVTMADGGFSGAASVYSSATGDNGDIDDLRWTDSNIWNDDSVMGCADCHTVDGANHDSGNAHGSDFSEYLLKAANGTALLGTRAAGNYNCWRCHDSNYYDYGGTVDHTGKGNDWVDTVGNIAPDRSASSGNIFGMACTNCHGGVESGTQAAPVGPEFGTIHGTSQTFGVGDSGVSSTRQAYRFMNGNSLRYYDPAGWTGTDVTCYTIDGGEEDSFGACSAHSGGRGPWTKPVQRDLKY